MIRRKVRRTLRASRSSRVSPGWTAIGVTLTFAIVVASLSGCNHVPLETGAEDVRVIEAAEAEGCKRVGSTQAKVLARIVGFKRGEDKMSEELTTLARNAALEKQANAVSPESEITDGSQKFGIYSCP